MRTGSPLAMCAGCIGTLVAVAACVPADEALPLGSAEFTITGRGSPRTIEIEEPMFDGRVDRWSLHVDRFLLSFRTMTIVNLAIPDQCAYRGRGAATNVVIDGTVGSVVQAFNGIMPGDCPDVGMRLGPPDDRTIPGEGATTADLLSLLADGSPAHAIFEATVTHEPTRAVPDQTTIKLSLRFDSARTASSFGGCRDAIRGARIHPEARDAIFVAVAAEAFFRNAITTSAELRIQPFLDADLQGNNDGVVTMEELDQQPLSGIGGFYQLPNGSHAGSFGDYVRAQFMFAVKYGNGGLCNGIEPGTEDVTTP